KYQSGYTYPNPPSGPNLHFQVEVRNLQMLLRTMPDAAILTTHFVAQRPEALQETLTGLVQSFGCAIPKKFLCALVPRTNLTLIRYREGGVRCSIEQLEQRKLKHLRTRVTAVSIAGTNGSLSYITAPLILALHCKPEVSAGRRPPLWKLP